MPFISEWAENYALEWLRDHISFFLPELIQSQREEIAKLEERQMPLWPLLTDDFRQSLLEKAYSFAPTILALPLEDVMDVVMECLGEHQIQIDRRWIKSNLLAFRQELQKTL